LQPDKFWIYLLDNLFSVAIPGSLVISVWRGQWAILDHILMSDTLMKSLFISAGLGFGITVLLFFLQWPAALTSQALERRHWNILKIVFEDSFYIVACFAAVNVWRSVWGLCDQLILTDNYPLSNLICHLVGAFGTMIL
jgi:Fuseless